MVRVRRVFGINAELSRMHVVLLNAVTIFLLAMTFGIVFDIIIPELYDLLINLLRA